MVNSTQSKAADKSNSPSNEILLVINRQQQAMPNVQPDSQRGCLRRMVSSDRPTDIAAEVLSLPSSRAVERQQLARRPWT